MEHEIKNLKPNMSSSNLMKQSDIPAVTSLSVFEGFITNGGHTWNWCHHWLLSYHLVISHHHIAVFLFCFIYLISLYTWSKWEKDSWDILPNVSLYDIAKLEHIKLTFPFFFFVIPMDVYIMVSLRFQKNLRSSSVCFQISFTFAKG